MKRSLPPSPKTECSVDVDRIVTTMTKSNDDAATRFERVMEKLVTAFQTKQEDSQGVVTRLIVNRNQRGLIDTIDVERG